MTNRRSNRRSNQRSNQRSSQRFNHRAITASVFAMVCVLMTGCYELSTDYGTSKGRLGRTSLNGFGALRSAYENSGLQSRDVSRLTDRVGRSDVIVWTPQVPSSIDDKVTRWFDRWLRTGGKTLVYVMPDSGSEADYWMEAGRSAPPNQRMEYRTRAARSINQRMTWRLNRGKWNSNGWFAIEPLPHRSTLPVTGGRWRSDLKADGKVAEFTSEYFVTAYNTPDPNAAPNPATMAAAPPSGPTGPNAPGFSWSSDPTPTRTSTTFRPLVKTSDGKAIVAEFGSDSWKDSKIIVVAGGSLLTNFALAHDRSQKLAGKLIEASTANNSDGDEQSQVGFMTSDWASISVSETKPGVPVSSGMELLTVWPLSLVTMHGVMLGLVICLTLVPIFGRPQRVHVPEHTDFGDHLDAVAGLMLRAGGEDYARGRISEYFKRIHGETSGPWVIADRVDKQEKAVPLPPLRTVRRDIPTPD